MNALAASGRTNLLASPHIIATDNVAAEIKVGENIPLQTNIGGGVGGLASAAGGLGSGLPLAGLVGMQTPREDVGNKIKVTPHINESDQVRLEIEQESSAGKAGEGELGAVTITKRTAKTTVVVKDQQTVVIGGLTRDEFVTSKTKVPILGDIPVLGLLFSSTSSKKIKTNLLLVLTPHVIREQDDLRRIFERKMQERQEFIDRYFVFAPDSWKAPLDYTRLNGVVEDIRQAYFAVDARQRLEDELKPRDLHEHVPGEPVDLPSDLRADAGGSPASGGAPAAPAPARRKAPRRQRNTPGAAPAATPAPPPPAPTGTLSGDDPAPTAELAVADEPSLRVAPPLRSVMNSETAE
jgi:general secretion pathway protein D